MDTITTYPAPSGRRKGITAAVSCSACSNSSCLIRKNISSGVIEQLSHDKRIVHCKKGQHFILEGAAVNGLFFVLNGKVKVFRTGIYGKEQIVRLAKEGEIIGHRGFGTLEFYSIAAMALEDTSLCYFSKNSLQLALKEDAPFTYDLMRFYANELNKTEARVKTLSQMTVRERVIDALLYVQDKFGQTKGYISLALSRREYADYSGTTEEQVIRVLSALKKENAIYISGKKIAIPNPEILKKELMEHQYIQF